MRLEEYRQVYDKVSLSKEADERILHTLMEGVQDSGKKQHGKGVGAVRIAAAVVVLVLAAGIMQFPAVASTTHGLVSRFTNIIIDESVIDQSVIDEKGWVEGIDYGKPTAIYDYSDSAEYLDINSDAPKEECKMESLAEVSKVLGVELLQSKEAHEEKDCIEYTPYVSDSGALNGVVLMDDFYVLGDIRDVECNIFPKVEECNSIFYRPGQKYQSPIKMEITIRTSDSEGVDHENHELDYDGRTEVRGEGNRCEIEEIYEIQNLGGVNAALSVDETDGVSTWGKLEGEDIRSCVSAFFLYQGVEYRYVGAVSVETMQEFLEGLEIPEQK